MLKRKIESVLVEWKTSGSKKPLVIKGIRQCGKTYMCFDLYVELLVSDKNNWSFYQPIICWTAVVTLRGF